MQRDDAAVFSDQSLVCDGFHKPFNDFINSLISATVGRIVSGIKGEQSRLELRGYCAGKRDYVHLLL